EIQVIVRNLCKRGISILITDHIVRETLRITDLAYVITDGQVVAQGKEQEILRNQTVIQRYLGHNFAEEQSGRISSPLAAMPAAPTIVPMPASPRQTIDAVLTHERIFELIEQLKSDEKETAERELLQIGRSAISQLIEALERRDLELRRMAYHVLCQMEPNVGDFDAYAPEMQRRQQIDRIRDFVLRRAA
ncbi:MAG TPA: hypothetical protein PKD72_08795, partial [Gemmatales bacterium]|nr:hypothetical protein [Gemmatales bacterium]